MMANGLEDRNNSPLERTIYMERLKEPRQTLQDGRQSSRYSIKFLSNIVCFFFLARQPQVGQGLLIQQIS